MFRKLILLLIFCFSLEARLYFIHIPKTAGTTLRQLLEMQLDSGEIYPYKNHMQAKGSVDHELVSGHFPFWFCEKLDPDFDRSFKVTILRDPVERYLSFLRAKKRGNPKFLSLESVMSQRLVRNSREQIVLIDNALCRNLASNPNLQGEALLRNAKENLEKIDYILFFEEFDRDVTDLFSRLGVEIEEIPKTNVTVKEPASEALVEEIRKLHELDRQLYDYAKRELQPKNREYRLRTESFDRIVQKTAHVDYRFNFPLDGRGWTYREKSDSDGVYRWVTNEPASIYFSLDEGQDYHLSFSAHPLTPEICPKVLVNGHEIELSKQDERYFSTYSGSILKEWVTSGKTEIVFYSPQSFPYSQIYPEFPNRNYPPLSFALNRIKISVPLKER